MPLARIVHLAEEADNASLGIGGRHQCISRPGIEFIHTAHLAAPDLGIKLGQGILGGLKIFRFKVRAYIGADAQGGGQVLQAGLDFLGHILVPCEEQGGAIFGRQNVTCQADCFDQVPDGMRGPVIRTTGDQYQVRAKAQ